MTGKSKRVEELKEKVLRKVITFPGISDSVESEAEIDALQYWDEEISRLQGKSFETIDEAIREVIDAVLARLESSSNMEQKKEQTEFLFELFSQDPELLSEVRASVTITSKKKSESIIE